MPYKGWCAIRCDWTPAACHGSLPSGGIVRGARLAYYESGRLPDWIGVRCMIRAKPDDFVRLPADALAQIMLQCASDDPTLVRRSRSPAKSVQVQTKLPSTAQHESGSPLTLLSNSDRATKQYLEDLVSIAVASAERADDVLNQANATRRKANRAVWAFASVAAVGVVVGTVGVVSSRLGNATDGKLTEIASEVRSLGAQQELTNHQLTVVQSDVSDVHEAAAAIQEAATPARPDAAISKAETEPQVAAVPQSQPNIVAPVSPVQQATYSSSVWPQRSRAEQPTTYSAPWPQRSRAEQPTTYSSPWPQRTQPVWSARHRQQQQPTVPRFLVAIQQNLRALFR
jgi:hypothetical protein